MAGQGTTPAVRPAQRDPGVDVVTAAVVTFPPCPVRGHDGHELTLVSEHVQDGTGQRAYMIACPGGRYRFFYIPVVFERVGSMVRFTRPRHGWPAG